jgi:two-component system, sensor histidine kinase and response regulator
VPMLRREPLLECPLVLTARGSVLTTSLTQDLLELAAGQFGLGFWTWDAATDRLRADANTSSLYGLDPAGGPTAEVLSRIVPSEDAAAVRSAIEATAATGRETSFTGRMKRPDGSISNLELRFRPSRGTDGTVRHVLAVASPERSVEAQRRLERTSAWIQEGHWEVDLSNSSHWASPTYYALLGYEPGEITFDTVAKVQRIVHPEDNPLATQLAAEHVCSGVPYTTELRVRTKDGTYRWFQLRARAEQDASGRAIRLAGSIRDIHQQRLTEDSLERVRQRFDRAVRGTRDGLWEWDQTTRTLWLSPRYEAILGFGEGELARIAQRADSMVHEDDIELFRRAQREHIGGNKPFDVEVRMRTKSGSYRWIRVNGDAERDAAGLPLRVAGSMQDVTEARESRDALILASEAAQAANRAKSDFLANVSHEIRTPMNGIVGMTSLLLDTPLDATQKNFAETIRSSADSLLCVINDILDFSKIEAGRLDIESIEMDPCANAREVAAIMGFQAAARGLELAVNVAPGVPARVIGDPQRIRQCLVNLIGNAVKFTREGRVVAEVSAIGEREGCVLTRFEVRDTGIGIKSEVLKTLFQPFVQADSSTTRHFGGTGLGLSIVRRLVDMMGGEVGVESEEGKGSRFWFVLPLRPVAAAPPRAVRAPQLAQQLRFCAQVLLVEDNPVNQQVACRFLERLGCRVVLAANGAEGIDAWQKAEFDLILMDMQMPVMDGYTAAARIRELETGRRHTPIVALTANAMSGELARVTNAGMDGLLTKPLNADELGHTLARFCVPDETELAAKLGA